MNKIIYLDAAASSLKPQSVIDAEMDFLQNKYANSGRGVCARAGYVDSMVADARDRIAGFINASQNQIVFTSGTTDGMNRIAGILKNTPGVWPDHLARIMVSDLDHHSARMPFEEIFNRGDAVLNICQLDKNLNIDLDKIGFADFFVITAMSNVTGVAQDVKAIINAAKKVNPSVITIVDAAQYVAHQPIDVVDWDCDFLCFSGHKIGADTGVGIMYIRDPERMHPDKFGGGMINKINPYDSKWMFEKSPNKFEAGTLPLTQIAGLPYAINNLEKSGDNSDLTRYLYDALSKFDRIEMISNRDASLIAFTVKDMHCLDFGALMGAHNICLRVGNMCSSWLHKYLGIEGSVRMSCGWWNTKQEIDTVIEAIKKVLGK